jgi:integrase
MHHIVLRRGGKLIREPVGHNRKEAQRALDSRRGEIADRRYSVIKDLRFDEWSRQWLSVFTGKENSRRVYSTTIAFATEVFGSIKVRDLDVADIRRFMEHIASEYRTRHARSNDEAIRSAEVAPSTLAKHLRQLSTCLQAAISEGYATENPVKRLHKSARPRVAKSKPAYFTDVELARLWPEMEDRPVYLFLHKIAVTTGMRFGELAALEWSDIDLLVGEVHVGKTYAGGIGVTPPKSNEARTVDLSPQARVLFEEWFKRSERNEGLVFRKEAGGLLDGNYTLKRVLYPAMERAAIVRVGERGRKRDFHSFRHTFARVALEAGAPIDWVKGQLGHSSITLTVDVYGEWAREIQKAQAAQLAGAFAV